jgi:hypothetical protein
MPGMQDIGAALLLGLVGSTHCLGMCGGISSALGFALGPRCTPLRRHGLLLLYSTGRVGSYAVMGALAGGALALAVPQGMQSGLRIAAGAMLVLTGLALAGWSGAMAVLERGGSVLWRRIAPLAARIGAPDRVHVALLAGAAWGWLPCGLVYGTLAWASSHGGAAHGATLMAAFGIGTVPAVVASGSLAAQLRRLLARRELRLLAALCVVGFGIWTMAAAGGGDHGQHSHHHH